MDNLINGVLIFIFAELVFAPAIIGIFPTLYILFHFIKKKIKPPKAQKKLGREVYILAIFGVVVAVLYIGLIIKVGQTWCDERYTDKLYSPDNRYYVEVFTDSCGGAAGSLTENVIIHQEDSKESENVLFVTHGDKITPEWTDSQTLKIHFSLCWAAQKQLYSWKNIKVIYDKNECVEPPPPLR